MAATAQSTQNSPQVSQQVVPTVVSGYKNVGALPGSAQVFVTLGIPLQNLQSLDYVTQQISTPGSPTYHHFLTQQQVQSYLPVSQYEAALASLTSDGLRVVSSSLDSIIVAEGTASQVSQALGLTYEVYTNGTSTYYTSSGTSPVPGVYLYSSNVTAVLLQHPTDLVTKGTVASVDSSIPAQTNQTTSVESYPIRDLQSVYNATGLYSAGYSGSGYTAGILDYYGDPYIAGQLQYYDSLYNIANSPFTVTPIGPYNPSLGVLEGWDVEISLDVEAVHTMAPHAAIDLYIANGAFPLSSAIAAIVQADKVNDVSQSFGYPDAAYSVFGASFVEMNQILPDQYYELGSAEGITFLASTGDTGGSGESAGPEGTPAYPSDSPYVVAVGGTTTYLTYDGSKVSSFYQTAWSNYGFVPDEISYGGGTGGVSVLEPRPWYQSGLSSPAGFADGRLVPDISLNANVYPGIIAVFPGNLTGTVGGTSESVQLLGGLLTLLMGSSKSSLGLLNPTLYSFGQTASISAKVYHPVTFGYIIPWIASAGYNLVTGWGAPDIGAMASYIHGSQNGAKLDINVTSSVGGASQFNVFPGQLLTVSALVTSGGSTVTSGSFAVQLDALSGPTAAKALSYDAQTHDWSGQFTVPGGVAGVSYLTVSGSSQGTSGTGYTELFSGYVGSFLSPAEDEPYSTQFGLPVDLNVTTLSGVPATGVFNVTALTYSIQSNTYSKAAATSVSLASTEFGRVWSGIIKGQYAVGPMLLTGGGDVYGYLPFLNGVSLRASFIETSVLAEPGAAGPGQSIFVLASLFAPVNTPFVSSQETGLSVSSNVEFGSNVTASLVSQSGTTIAKSQLYLNSYLSSSELIQGTLEVPSTVRPGVYNVILTSTYYSPDLSTSINGSYFGQVYIAPALTKTTISITPSSAYEGQTVVVNAKIAYPNGTAVRYGTYSATVYPTDLQNAYNSLTQALPVALWFDSSTDLWSGNITLPSPYNSGGTVTIDPGALYLSGPYEVFVSGVSADGVPSNTDISTQQRLQVQPYLYLNDATVSSPPQWSQVAFVDDMISGGPLPSTTPTVMSNDLFIGSNTIEGGATISQSQIEGTLILSNADVTLIGVTGGTVIAQNSKVVLEQSSLNSLTLTNSQVSMNASVVDSISPSAPVISIQSPASGLLFSGNSGNFTVTGDGVMSVSVYVDGTLLKSFSGSGSYDVALNASSMSVGVHNLNVVAAQQDGISTSSSVSFSTDGPLVAATNTISSLTTQLSSQNSKIGALNSKLDSASNLSYGLAAVAVLALIIAIVALVRRPSAGMSTASQPATPPSPAPPQEPAPASTMVASPTWRPDRSPVRTTSS